MASVSIERYILQSADETSGWDDFVQSHPRGTIFSTKRFIAAYTATPGYDPLAIAAIDSEGNILGVLVAVLIETKGPWPSVFNKRSVMFVEPIAVPGQRGIEAVRELIREHDQRMSGAAVFSEIRPVSPWSEDQDWLIESGYKSLNYRNYELDLTEKLEDIFRGMSPKRRNNVRSNERRGLTVREGMPAEDMDLFFEHMQHSYQHARMPLVCRQHFVEVFASLQTRDYRLTIAELNGVPIASACHLCFGNRVFWWSAGTQRISGISAQASLVWESIQWAANQGYKVYDFAGAGWEGEDYGPGTFKARFGGQEVNCGRYRKVYSKWRMRLAVAGFMLARPLFANSSTDESSS